MRQSEHKQKKVKECPFPLKFKNPSNIKSLEIGVHDAKGHTGVRFTLSVCEGGMPSVTSMIIFSLSNPPDAVTEDYGPPDNVTGYVMGNLIRIGVAAVIVLILGGFLVEAWHSQRLSPNRPW